MEPKKVETVTISEDTILRPYGVGIDTHKKFIQVCILCRRAGEITSTEYEFTTLRAGLEQAKAAIQKTLGLGPNEPFAYTIESTGLYHVPILLAFGGTPSVVNPLLAGHTRRKTDVLDARLLARQAITGLWKPSYIAFPDQTVLRILWNEHIQAQQAALRAILRCNGILLRYGHTITSIERPSSEEAIARMYQLADGRIPNHPGASFNALPAPVCAALKRSIELHEEFKRRQATARKDAIAWIHERSWPTDRGEITGVNLMKFLTSVPGVGQLTALTWLTTVGDPRRFARQEQVAAYAGCDPSLKVSAGKVTEHVRRKGNKDIHYALTMAAASLVARPRELMGQGGGASIAGRSKRGGFMKARGAVARRIACALWHVHMKAEPFSYEKYNFMPEIRVPDISVEDMGLGRYEANLRAMGLNRSTEVVQAWRNGRLGLIPGIGEAAFARVRAWYEDHKHKTKEQTNDPRHTGKSENSDEPDKGDKSKETRARKRGTTK